MEKVGILEEKIDEDILYELYELGFSQVNRFTYIEELEEYLDKIFIPNNVYVPNNIYEKNLNVIDESQLDKSLYVRAFKFTRLKLSASEAYYAINYLNDKGITILGQDNRLCDIFPNYLCMITFRGWRQDFEVYNQEETEKLLSLYKETKDLEIRNKIVEANMRLVHYISSKFSYLTNHPIEEVYSYGYETLIKCIDKYDVDLKTSFTTFALKSITRKILYGIAVVEGFTHLNEFFDYFNVRCSLTKGLDRAFLNTIDMEIDDEVLKILSDTYENDNNLIDDKYNYSSERLERISFQLKQRKTLGFDSIDEQDFFSYLDIQEEKESLSKIVSNSFRILKPREQEFLKLHYGFNDDNLPTSLREIGKMYGISRTAVLLTIKKALEKLRRPTNYNRLRDYYEDSFKENTSLDSCNKVLIK